MEQNLYEHIKGIEYNLSREEAAIESIKSEIVYVLVT
jgi:hypothetical protein